MSTSKHIEKICIAAVSLMLVITILFMNGKLLGITATAKTMGYESRLFDDSCVHTIEIVMDDWDSFIENCESEEYSNCAVVIDGEAYKNVAIRAKGNTSLSNVKSLGSSRYSFKIEFDHYDSSKSYYGLDKLCLNNLIQDNTMMKDYLVYKMMYEFGVDAPLCSFVYITVNGEDWGLYLAVEGIENSFLARNYGNESGNLYKPDSMSFGGGRGNGKDFDIKDFDIEDFDIEDFDIEDFDFEDSNIKDFKPEDFARENFDFENFDFENFGMHENFEKSDDAPNTEGFAKPDSFNKPTMGSMGNDDVKLKYTDDDPDSYSNIFDNAKTDITNSDKKRLINSLKDLSEYENLSEVLDMDEVLRYFVVHNFVINGDSYTGSMIHNYYLYEEDGQLSMIPWDYNLAFGTFMGGNASSQINASIDNPVSGDADDRPMVGWIFSNEEYTDMYHTLFEEFIAEWFDSGKLESLINDTYNLIRPYVESDPSKFCTLDEFDSGVETIKQFVLLRALAVTNQLNGDTTLVDTGDLDLSLMGTMSMGMGQGGGFGDMPEGFENFGGFGQGGPGGNAPEGFERGGPNGFERERK